MKRLLIIENDIDTIDVIESIFEGSEFEVVKFRKKISIDEIIEINPNLALVDYLLEAGYGSDLCLEIKSHPATKHIPVILFSASFNVEKIARDSHADAFIAKPFDLYHFLKLVDDLAL